MKKDPVARRKRYRRAYCRESPIRRHYWKLARPTPTGVPGVCIYCQRRRLYPHTIDFRGFPLSDAAKELEGFTGHMEERHADDE